MHLGGEGRSEIGLGERAGSRSETERDKSRTRDAIAGTSIGMRRRSSMCTDTGTHASNRGTEETDNQKVSE